MLRDGASLDYDYLIVATGARHAYFGHPEWETFAPGLKTLDDALLMRRRILLAFERAEREEDAARRGELLTFVLVGGGPTGVELAGTLAEITRQTLRDEFQAIDTARARIVVVEAGPSILSSFREELRDAARRSLGRLGVEVREDTRVVGIDAHGVDVQTGEMRERITAGHGALGGGRRGVAARPDARRAARPRRPRARRARPVDCRASRGVRGRRRRRRSSTPATACRCRAWCSPRRRARRTPRARSCAASGASRPRRSSTATSATWRSSAARRRSPISAGSASPGLIGWLAWLFLHIVKLIGFRNRVVVLIEWAVAYMTFQRGARLITGDEKEGSGL